MKLEINVPEVLDVFQEISAAPEKLFEMMRLDLQEMAGDLGRWYLLRLSKKVPL